MRPRGRVDHEVIWGPIGALVLLAARFIPFQHLPAVACPFHVLTGLPCVSCGGTRAFIALTRLDVAGALAMNPMAALLGLFTALYVLHALGVWLLGWRRWRPALTSGRARLAVRAAAVSVLAANWVYLIAVGR